jgi:hypothetical protein
VIGRGGAPARIAGLCALLLCAPASFAHAAPAKEAAPPETADPRRLHRIEALVEASQFPKIYDATMQGVGGSATADDSGQLMRHVMGMIVWSRSRDLWLPLMARTITDDVLERAEAFYASNAGHALVACIREAQGIDAIRACGSIPDVGGTDVRTYADGEFLRPQHDDDEIDRVMSQAFCRTLADDRPTLQRFAALCARDASARICAALVGADDGTTLDPDRCLGDLSGP